jgi:hypothetical protein
MEQDRAAVIGHSFNFLQFDSALSTLFGTTSVPVRSLSPHRENRAKIRVTLAQGGAPGWESMSFT